MSEKYERLGFIAHAKTSIILHQITHENVSLEFALVSNTE